MNQSTENLIYTSCDQLNGYVNDAVVCQSGAPPSLTFDIIPEASAQTFASAPQSTDGAPGFVLGPFNQRKRLLSCIVENWPECDSYNSLPVEINQSPRHDIDDGSAVPMKKPFAWEAEDVKDYITTLDEACILDIESYEDITQITDQHQWAAQTYGPIYEPLLKPGENCYDRPKSLCINFETHPHLNGERTATTTPSNELDEKYARIMTTDLDHLPYQENGHYSALQSTDNLVLKGLVDDEFLYLHPAYNRSKCRTPLPILSLNSSFYDESTSMNSSMYDANTLTASQASNDKTFMGNKLNTINPLENSVIELDGDKMLGEDQMSNMQVAAENDLQEIRKLLETESTGTTGGASCPSCKMPFDKGKKRKLIDNCGHGRCYSCMFKNEECPVCRDQLYDDKKDLLSCNMRKLQDYDTGIGESTTTISPLGSPQPTCRSSGNAKTNGFFANYLQLRHDKTSVQSSPTKSPARKAKLPLVSLLQSIKPPPSGGLADITVHSCATPPQHRRRLFNTKNLRSPFGSRQQSANGGGDTNSILSGRTSSPYAEIVVKRRMPSKCNGNSDQQKAYHRLSLGGTSAYAGHLSSLVFGKIKSLWTAQISANAGLNQLATDDEGAPLKPFASNDNNKDSQNELQTRLEFFLEGSSRRSSARTNVPVQSCSSLTSTNTSPVSTLTGSSEADVSRVLQESNVYNMGADSIGSLMSVSISGQSNGSASPAMSRRHSVTTAQQGHIEDLELFKTRKAMIRRSARSAQLKEPHDPKIRFAQYRPPQLKLKPMFFEVPQQEPDPIFVGRQWLLREMSNAFSNTETRGILLSGHPGTGKSALILQLVEYSCFGRRYQQAAQENDGIICSVNVAQDRVRALASHVVAYHFCQADNNTTCLVPDFIHSLAAQLCQAPQLASYRDYLLGEPHLQHILSVKECIADPERAMKMGILEPLANLRRVGKISAKNCIILIDALCEAEYHRPDHGDTIATFLSKLSEHFPSWLRIIATVRTLMLDFTKGLAYTKISLDTWVANDNLQKDMLDYITFRINHSPSILKNINAGKDSSQAKFVQHLMALSRGSMLFTKLSLDLIERGYLVIKSNSYKVLPVSLAQIFLLHFNLRFSTSAAYEKVLNILNVCLAAMCPLTLTEIFYAVNALHTKDALEWDDFLFRFKQLAGFLVKRIDNTYMFFHPSFREWLIRRDEGESSKFLCDARMGHAAIAFRLSRLQVPLDGEQTLEMGHHILKAHIYRNPPPACTPRDLQSYWLSTVSACVSSALCTLRNVYSPNSKVSRLMLLAGGSPDFITEFLGQAPIMCIAAHEGNLPMVSLLLEFGANVELSNSQGCTPLILASARGHCDVVRQLVAAGSLLGQTDTANRCALVHAAQAGKLHIVKYLLACDWATRSATNDVSLEAAVQQALIAAASQGHTAIIEELLDMDDIEIDDVDTLAGETALTSASKNGCTETSSTLLLRGAQVDGRNKKAMSPLLLAVKDGHWAVTERLLQNDADIEQVDPNEKTALIIAAEEGHVGLIELLLNRNALLTAKDRDGLTALSWACLRGHLQAAKCLAERNANLQHPDNTGRTPLDLAAYQGSSALVQMLLDKGVKIEHVDMNGMRPLDRAIAFRNIQVVQVFLRRGAKLGPATWAMATGKPEILLLLLNKLLEDGNILYRKNRLQEAAHRYQYALRKIPSHTTCGEFSSTFLQLKVNFLLNHSRCKRKMNEIAEALDLATEAIELRPDSYEGYYARSKVHLEMVRMNEAMSDAKKAYERSNKASTDIKNVLRRLQEDISQRIQAIDTGKLVAESMDTITDL